MRTYLVSARMHLVSAGSQDTYMYIRMYQGYYVKTNVVEVRRHKLRGPLDFSDAGRMMTSSRSTMDSKYVEMILFLHGNLDLIPQDIPKLSAAAAQDKIPGRLVNPVEGLEQLDGAFAPVDLTDGEEGASA